MTIHIDSLRDLKIAVEVSPKPHRTLGKSWRFLQSFTERQESRGGFSKAPMDVRKVVEVSPKLQWTLGKSWRFLQSPTGR